LSKNTIILRSVHKTINKIGTFTFPKLNLQLVVEAALPLVLISGFFSSLFATALGFLKFGSWFSKSPISDPISEVDPNFDFNSVLEFCLDPALLPGLEVLGVLDTLGVLLESVEFDL